MEEPTPRQQSASGPPQALNIAVTLEVDDTYIVTFAEPLTGVQLAAVTDLIDPAFPDAAVQFKLTERSWIAVHALEREEQYELLCALAEVFQPQTPLTAAGNIDQSALGFEARFEVLNFDDETPRDTLDKIVGQLQDIAGINAAGREDQTFIIQVSGRFPDRRQWLVATLAERLGIQVALYDIRVELAKRFLKGILRS